MTLETADFEALAALWNRFHPERYAVDAALLRANSIESPVFDWGASVIDAPDGPVRGFAIVKKSACPSLFKGPDPDSAHLSAIAFDDPVVGVDILAGVKRILRNRGIEKLIFGQDSRHFFPGCPTDAPLLRDFLKVEGFEESGEAFDVERDLTQYEIPAKCAAAPEGVQFRRLDKADVAALEVFLAREFPGRWLYDTRAKIAVEERADFVIGLWHEERLEGYAVTQDASHRLPVGGGVWRQSLGERWGALGPIGVAKRLRGKGLGDALLAAGLQDLQHRGVGPCLIDWTGLDRYYGGHGFEITRRYANSSLSLRD